MKAVIWTDVTQTIMMFLGVILSIIFGMINFIIFFLKLILLIFRF